MVQPLTGSQGPIHGMVEKYTAQSRASAPESFWTLACCGSGSGGRSTPAAATATADAATPPLPLPPPALSPVDALSPGLYHGPYVSRGPVGPSRPVTARQREL